MPEQMIMIDDAFFIEGRGVVLLCPEDRSVSHPLPIRVGDDLEIAANNGEAVRAKVTGIEGLTGPPSANGRFCVLVTLPQIDLSVFKGTTARICTSV